MEEGEYGFQKAKKYTGKDLDEDTELYYYNARWYDAEIGRFTSADSYKGELENPQSLNVYIYTSNNPLIYVDPSGHTGFLTGENNWRWIIRREDPEQAVKEYNEGASQIYIDSAEMMVLGDYSDKFMPIGLGGQILLDFTGIDIICDVRDFSASVKNKDYIGMAFNGIGIIPVIGMVQNLKYLKRVDDLESIKYLNDGSKVVEGLSENFNNGRKVLEEVSNNGKNINNGVDFYVKSNGDIIPSTGYRTIGGPAIDAAKKGNVMSEYGDTYLTFNNLNGLTSIKAKDILQLKYEPSMFAEFDTLQIIDDIKIPKGKWGTADYLEPITKDYIEFGIGGATQAVTNTKIMDYVLKEFN